MTGSAALWRPPAIIWSILAGGVLLVAAGLAGLDGAIVRAVAASGVDFAGINRLIALFDLVSFKETGMYLLGPLLILAGIALGLIRGRPIRSSPLLYVGLTQFAVTCIGHFPKPLFGRLRPYQALQGGEWSDRWFMGWDYGSFPSGHVAFYLGLFLPIALLLPPRWSLALLIIPALVAVQRIVSLSHYLSDTAASAASAALVAWLLASWLRPDGLPVRPSLERPRTPGL